MSYKYYFYDSDSRYQPWELKHLSSLDPKPSKATQKYGLPTKSMYASQMYDTGGLVQTFGLTFKRVDSEETISNWDFIFEQQKVVDNNRYKGISQFFAQLQTSRPYYLRIMWDGDGTDPGDVPTGKFKVSITGMNVSFDPETPGTMQCTLTLTMRR